MPVSVRARLPASRAWRNSRLSAGPGGALVAGPLPGAADLAEDLALAEDGGVEPGGDARTGGATAGVVVVDVEVVAEVLGGEEGQLGEEVADVLVGAVEPLGRPRRPRCGCRSRARRPRRRARATHEVVQRLRQRGVVDRHPLEQVERGGPVVQSDDDDRHACRQLLRFVEPPSRIRSSIPESRAARQSSALGRTPRRPGARPAPRPAGRAGCSYSGPSWLAEPVAQPCGQRRAVAGGGHRDEQRSPAEPGRAGWTSSGPGRRRR